jgi:alkylhydroperoxidase/carboxymuconolactone decarboxylase family protein YurZ
MKARVSHGRRTAVLLLASVALTVQTPKFALARKQENNMITVEQPLDARQTAIPAISAATAVGDIARLNVALNEGLDAGLSLSEAREILVQMYAYTGFPRSLNALGELMKVAETRRQRGVTDAPGREPSPVPTGKALLDMGTDNQTKLSGGPVKGPLFEFAPAIDTFLKAHLFGDIFARDNLDWKSRELATVGALAAMTGVESQLQAHVRISMNIGLTPAALRDAAEALDRSGFPDAAKRARAAVEKQLASE